ncbi:hypothetical protein OHA71_34930 [Streptomyces sp. NBC_00444]|uniref:hypothetical protein n=1 Tax=Streptomyces sp. NBC_00444 TaxID=2975744 RepID=UPI002E21A421
MLLLYDTGLLLSEGSRSGFALAVAIVTATAVLAATVSYWAVEYPGSLLARARDRRGRPRDFYSP